MNKSAFALAFVLFLTGARCHAAGGGIISPVGLALVTTPQSNIEFPGPKSDVIGARVALLTSKNENVFGLDVGIIQNETTGNFGGVEIAGLSNVAKSAYITGLQFAGLRNKVGSLNGFGLQLAGLQNEGTAEGYFAGAQVAILRNADFGHFYGVQVGLVNKAKSICGLQIGLYNVAEDLHGIQIGLWNVNRSGPLKMFPGINIGF